jgi:peroxiredoxin
MSIPPEAGTQPGAAGARRAVILAAALVAAVAALLVLLPLRMTPAPQETFVSLMGERIPMPPASGKVMLVNFWATDCPVCIREMPDLVATHEKYRGRGLEIVAVAMRHDPPHYVIRYAEDNRLPFKVALDSLGEHAKAFGGVRATPTTFVIDRRGNIVERIVGMPDFGRLNALIETTLKD